MLGSSLSFFNRVKDSRSWVTHTAAFFTSFLHRDAALCGFSPLPGALICEHLANAPGRHFWDWGANSTEHPWCTGWERAPDVIQNSIWKWQMQITQLHIEISSNLICLCKLKQNLSPQTDWRPRHLGALLFFQQILLFWAACGQCLPISN